jgi:putative membrane protein
MLLPFAWLLVAGCSYIVARGAADLLSERNRKWIAPLLGATLSALVDLWMEPVMTRTLEYWRWKPNGPLPGGAPWSNLAGWFGVSLVAGMLLNRLRNPIPVENAAIVLIGQVVLLFGLRFI